MRIRHIVLSLLVALTAVLPLRAQVSDASLWDYHLSYHNATEAVAVGSSVYVLTGGNLMAYDTDDQSVRLLSRLNTTLSSQGIARMGHSVSQGCLVLLYDDNNIDLYFPDADETVNLPQVKNFSDYDITVNNLNVNGDYACLATTEGVIVIDLANQQVAGSYRIGENIREATVSAGRVYASTASKVISGSMNGNLYVRSEWSDAFTNLVVNQFVGAGEALYARVPVVRGVTDVTSGLCYITAPDAAGQRTLTRIAEVLTDGGTVCGTHAQFVGSNIALLLDTADPTTLTARVAIEGAPRTLTYAGGAYYGPCQWNGLKAYRFTSDGEARTLTADADSIGGYGPRYDASYRMAIHDGTLYVVGGTQDYQGGNHVSGFVGRYRNGAWSDMDHAATTAAAYGKNYHDVVGVAVNPLHPDSVAAVSYGGGLFTFADGKFVEHYDYRNSAIATAVSGNPNYCRMGGCAYDDKGNLWMTNTNVDSCLVVRRADGSWRKFFVPALTKNGRVQSVFLDTNGKVWLTEYTEGGLACFDYGGTFDDTSDDTSIYRTTANNEDGTSCELLGISPLVLDKDGRLWFGCASGVYYIEDPTTWFSTSFTIYQPKIPRNDGTNLADYLLSGVSTKAIVVDGGNQKWIGTSGGGLYLTNADGSAIIEHATAATTPLLSDNINTLAYDETTGTLYIGTDLGICSYRAGVTAPQSSLSRSNVRVYPNPVRPEYNGSVTVDGLTDGAEVKVVSAASQLVARGTATGGSYRWDVRSSASGQRVAPGVYYLLIATADGGTAVAAKVVVI